MVERVAPSRVLLCVVRAEACAERHAPPRPRASLQTRPKALLRGHERRPGLAGKKWQKPCRGETMMALVSVQLCRAFSARFFNLSDPRAALLRRLPWAEICRPVGAKHLPSPTPRRTARNETSGGEAPPNSPTRRRRHGNAYQTGRPQKFSHHSHGGVTRGWKR